MHGATSRPFTSKSGSVVEKVVQAGEDEELDQGLLYVTFCDRVMGTLEIKKHQSKVKRSSQSNRVHSYKWMHQAAKATLGTTRLNVQEAARENR